jgi:AcrR family transcriptional regulator
MMNRISRTNAARRSRVADTRDRIVDRALGLVHAQGFERTTLAQFAEAGEVPLGNFYYYFKTKGALGETLIDRRIAEYRSRIAEWEKDPSPCNRLLDLLAATKAQIGEITEHGCPVGSLTQELTKKNRPLTRRAGAVFDLLIDWCAQQFQAMDGDGDPEALAVQLIASLQGASVLANALGRPDLLKAEIERLSRWVREHSTISNAAKRDHE